MTGATILLYPGPRAMVTPLSDVEPSPVTPARRRSRVELAIRFALAFLTGIIAGIVLPTIALILFGQAFLAAIGG